MPFSVDLRERVIAAVDNNIPVTKVVDIFKVSRRVIYEWLELRKKTGSLEPKSGYQNGHSHKITNWDAFRIFVEANKHKTIKGMAIEWKKSNNEIISISAMRRSLKKIGYTSKKNFQLQRS